MLTRWLTITLLALVALSDVASGAAPEAVINVKAHGAKGDGKADDTAAIQAAVDAAGASGGTVLFPPGAYLVTSVGLRPGVRYLGYGATLRRPPNQPKFTRTFDAGRPGYAYSGDTDSQPLIIEGLTFDGSRQSQGEYTGYQLEQAHLIFLSADPKRAGRLQARIRDCYFRDGVADAIAIYTNVDAKISDCTARDCFRGGLTVTGGYTRVQVSSFTAVGNVHATGIDLEVDGAGFGGTHRIEVTMDGLMLQDGDFDVGVLDHSLVVGSNILAPRAPFNIYGGGTSTLRFTNSVFGVGEYSSDGNRITLPGDVTFTNCRFSVDGKSDATVRKWGPVHVYWSIGDTPTRGQSLKFIDCDFQVREGIAPADTTFAFFLEADRPENGNVLTVRGGRISADFDYGIYLSQGGTAVIKDVECHAATALRLGASEHYVLDVLIDGLEVTRSKTYLHMVTHVPASKITHKNLVLDEAVNVIGTDYGIVGNTYLGRRVILGRTPPSPATHGLLNDVYRLKEPVPGMVYEWICTGSGSGSGAVWKPLTRVSE